MPTAETVVNWLIEHIESLPADDSDSESVSSVDYDSDTDSTSDALDDLDSSGEVSEQNMATFGKRWWMDLYFFTEWISFTCIDSLVHVLDW